MIRLMRAWYTNYQLWTLGRELRRTYHWELRLLVPVLHSLVGSR